MPLQIAQVQVSTELLDVSGMDLKYSSPKTVLPLVCLRNLPAVAEWNHWHTATHQVDWHWQLELE